MSVPPKPSQSGAITRTSPASGPMLNSQHSSALPPNSPECRSTQAGPGLGGGTGDRSRGTRRDGFVYHPDGLDLGSALAAVSGGRPVAQPGGHAWPSAIEGLRATEADLLVEVTASPPDGGEPGLTHMREALQRGIPVVTSNKWPVALHGAELAALARGRGVAFRAESTVMSGTPVLSALTEGLAGSVPVALRGVLNATVNVIVSKMADGLTCEEALAEAQDAGLAEPDPAADVEGWDATAKVMILSALVFGRQLSRDQVACRGITGITGPARPRWTRHGSQAAIRPGATSTLPAWVIRRFLDPKAEFVLVTDPPQILAGRRLRHAASRLEPLRGQVRIDHRRPR